MLVLLGKYLKLKNKYDNPHILEQKFNASCKTELTSDQITCSSAHHFWCLGSVEFSRSLKVFTKNQV